MAKRNIHSDELAVDTTDNELYRRNPDGTYTRITSGGAGHVTNPNGVVNGGWKVYEVSHPARDVFLDFFFGSDDTLSSALTANQWTSPNVGLFVDMSVVDVNHRSVVIVNGNASPSYSYRVYFSRNGGGSETDDIYLVASGTSTSQIKQINLPASLGYDAYVRLDLNPDIGQTGTQLTFKAYLIGRGS